MNETASATVVAVLTPPEPALPATSDTQPKPTEPPEQVLHPVLDLPPEPLPPVHDDLLTGFGAPAYDDAGALHVPTRVWAGAAAVALVLGIAVAGVSAAQWRHDAQRDRELATTQADLRKLTGDFHGLAGEADAVNGTATDLQSRLKAVEQAAGQLGQLGGMDQRIAALEATALELKNDVATAAQADAAVTPDTIAALQTQVDALTAQLTTLQATMQSLCAATTSADGSAAKPAC